MRKYPDIKVEHTEGCSFALSTERDGRKVTFSSAEPYSYTTRVSKLLSRLAGLGGEAGSVEIDKTAPCLTIEDRKKGLEAYILYDKERSIVILQIKKEGEFENTFVSSYGSIQKHLSTPMNERDAKKLMKRYERLFKEESRLLGVRRYEKTALAGLSLKL